MDRAQPNPWRVLRKGYEEFSWPPDHPANQSIPFYQLAGDLLSIGRLHNYN